MYAQSFGTETCSSHFWVAKGSGSGRVVPVVPSATGGVQTGPLWKLRCHCEGPQTAGARAVGPLGPRGRDLLRIPYGHMAIWFLGYPPVIEL